MNFSTLAFEKKRQTSKFLQKFGDETSAFLVTGSYGDVMVGLALLAAMPMSMRQTSIALIPHIHEQVATKFLHKKMRYEILTEHGYEHFMAMCIYSQDENQLDFPGLKVVLPSAHKNLS